MRFHMQKHLCYCIRRKGVRGLPPYGAAVERKPKGRPRQKSFNKIQEIKQKPNEDPSEFLEKIYQAYSHYIDADPENIRMDLHRAKRPTYKKITEIRWCMWNEPFSISRCCF